MIMVKLWSAAVIVFVCVTGVNVFSPLYRVMTSRHTAVTSGTYVQSHIADIKVGKGRYRIIVPKLFFVVHYEVNGVSYACTRYGPGKDSYFLSRQRACDVEWSLTWPINVHYVPTLPRDAVLHTGVRVEDLRPVNNFLLITSVMGMLTVFAWIVVGGRRPDPALVTPWLLVPALVHVPWTIWIGYYAWRDTAKPETMGVAMIASVVVAIVLYVWAARQQVRLRRAAGG